MKDKARFSDQIMRSRCPIAIDKARKLLQKTEHDLKSSLAKLREKKEKNILPDIKNDPSTFYAYARSFASTKSDIGPLMDSDENLVCDDKAMADILSRQYASMFSTPSSNIKREDVCDFFKAADIYQPPESTVTSQVPLGACGQ